MPRAIALFVIAVITAGCGGAESDTSDALSTHIGHGVSVWAHWNNDRQGPGQIASSGERRWQDGVVRIDGKIEMVTSEWIVIGKTEKPGTITRGGAPTRTFIPRDKVVLVDIHDRKL